MKHTKFFCVLLSLVLLLIPLSGCGNSDNGSSTLSSETSSQASSEAVQIDDTDFTYSGAIGDNGFWNGVTALDYVELFDYKAITVPADTHVITDEAVQAQIDSMLASYATSAQVTDRAVVDGDTVNIDYVGSVDGVEFEGGNTNGTGAEVTIGVTNYIDNFLEQLIGHNPGDTFNVEVTFPEDYGQDELNGKDAVFVTTINHIVETNEAELTDEFVTENLTGTYKATTVAELRDEIKEDLQKNAVKSYMQSYVTENTTVSSVPDVIVNYQEQYMVKFYEDYAVSFNMEMEEFLASYGGVSSIEELIETNAESNKETATYYLIIQAIAEDADITVSDADIAAYFKENMGSEDYSEQEEQYGLPYIKQVTLCEKVLDYLAENAELE